MKNNNLTNFLFVTMLLFSSMVGAETKYPAADFQPKVLYKDANYKSSQTSSTASKSAVSKPDPNYPAANFEPTVLYKDTDYKPGKTINRPASNVQASSSTVEDASAEEVEESMSTYLVGLVIFVLAGVYFLKKGVEPKQQSPKRSHTKAAAKTQHSNNAGGSTGVAAYLSRNALVASGVAKYLENRDKNPVSGVAKYVAKQVVSAKKAAIAKTTGVEKYLRSQG